MKSGQSVETYTYSCTAIGRNKKSVYTITYWKLAHKFTHTHTLTLEGNFMPSTSFVFQGDQLDTENLELSNWNSIAFWWAPSFSSDQEGWIWVGAGWLKHFSAQQNALKNTWLLFSAGRILGSGGFEFAATGATAITIGYFWYYGCYSINLCVRAEAWGRMDEHKQYGRYWTKAEWESKPDIAQILVESIKRSWLAVYYYVHHAMEQVTPQSAMVCF